MHKKILAITILITLFAAGAQAQDIGNKINTKEYPASNQFCLKNRLTAPKVLL